MNKIYVAIDGNEIGKIIEKYLFKSWHFFIFMIILGIVNGFYRVYKLIFYKSENNKKGKE